MIPFRILLFHVQESCNPNKLCFLSASHLVGYFETTLLFRDNLFLDCKSRKMIDFIRFFMIRQKLWTQRTVSLTWIEIWSCIIDFFFFVFIFVRISWHLLMSLLNLNNSHIIVNKVFSYFGYVFVSIIAGKPILAGLAKFYRKRMLLWVVKL